MNEKLKWLQFYQLQVFVAALSRAQHNNVSMQSIQIHFWDTKVLFSFYFFSICCFFLGQISFPIVVLFNFFAQTICSNGFPQIAVNLVFFSPYRLKKNKIIRPQIEQMLINKEKRKCCAFHLLMLLAWCEVLRISLMWVTRIVVFFSTLLISFDHLFAEVESHKKSFAE